MSNNKRILPNDDEVNATTSNKKGKGRASDPAQSKKDLVNLLVEEIITLANEGDGLQLDWLGKALVSAEAVILELVPLLMLLRAEREGIEIRLTDEEIARNQFSKIDLDLFSYLWERLNDERDRISQFNVLESIKKSYWTDRDDGRKMRLMFERASEKVRVFVIDEEAAGDGGLKGFKAYSNYKPEVKAEYAKKFGLISTGDPIIIGATQEVIFQSNFLPRLIQPPDSDNDVNEAPDGLESIPSAYTDFILVRQRLEAALDDAEEDVLELLNLLLDRTRDPSSFVTFKFNSSDLPEGAVALIRVDVLNDKKWPSTKNFLVSTGTTSIGGRSVWTDRGDGKGIEGIAVGAGTRADQRGHAGFYRNFRSIPPSPALKQAQDLVKTVKKSISLAKKSSKSLPKLNRRAIPPQQAPTIRSTSKATSTHSRCASTHNQITSTTTNTRRASSSSTISVTTSTSRTRSSSRLAAKLGIQKSQEESEVEEESYLAEEESDLEDFYESDIEFESLSKPDQPQHSNTYLSLPSSTRATTSSSSVALSSDPSPSPSVNATLPASTSTPTLPTPSTSGSQSSIIQLEEELEAAAKSLQFIQSKESNYKEDFIRRMKRGEFRAADTLAIATGHFFPKLLAEEKKEALENGEKFGGVVGAADWLGVMEGFRAGLHREVKNSESKYCAAVACGPGEPYTDDIPRPEGAVSFILGRLDNGKGVVIEGGEGTFVLWDSEGLLHGTGYQWTNSPDREGGTKMVNEYGFCRTKKKRAVGNARNLMERKVGELEELLESDEIDGMKDCIEFGTDRGPVWYRGKGIAEVVS